ncbi:zf-TFIIB domain-containing protein [Pseudoalteromonas sp. R3]|uniref:zf-TFIIB domain-containing protein n=1 Tax=Pseudoalteromonas sp. R3 TaxID=1709477 RepID=UPI001F4D631A|nr:zf-TFIIB domain-containing protein [Pseudoalteromonas sp. R3]
MKCTSCGVGQLRPGFIEGLFRAHSCDHCQGDWILIEDYVAWKERNPDYQFAEHIEFGEDVQDSKRALLCPVSGTLMRKFRISATSAHRVDYSVATGGLWLDKGEWQLLKAEGLAGALNQLVTSNGNSKFAKTPASKTLLISIKISLATIPISDYARLGTG